jgi:ABC-type nitrate/sulfonate/bicarbonate transport system substrate-binding protein
LACRKHTDSKSPELTEVRIGWQIPLATQGQIVQVLKHTNLLEEHGLYGRFVPFSYGGPQTEAALAGELDVIFVGDQPAVNLIARSGKWKIVSRLFYTRTAIMVPPDSPIKQMEDLRGKTVASPFGSVAHREAILKERAASLDPDKDVTNVNLDILEISSVVQGGGKETWGKIDAVAVWEPSTSLFEIKHLARVVDWTRTLGVVAISDGFIQNHSNETTQLLEAILKAWAYYASNRAEVDKWYINDARLSYSTDVLESASRVEPNITSHNISEIDLTLTENQLQMLDTCSQWAFERGYTKHKADIRAAVDLSFLEQATRKVRDSAFSPSNVRKVQ